MPPRVDERHLPGLLGTAGKSLARLPGAQDLIERVREAQGPSDLARILSPLDLGLEPPAREVIEEALADGARWEEVHATLVRSAEQSLAERFESGA